MYEYLANLDEGCTYAVVNTEGKLCVLTSCKAVKKEVALRHYAFLLDFMAVSVDRILFVCIDDVIAKRIKEKFRRKYKNLPCEITLLKNVQDANSYDYVIVYDAHNVDVFSEKQLSVVCSNVRNLCMFVSCDSIKEYPNIDIADFLSQYDFDFEISTGDDYSVAEYLEKMHVKLEQLRRIREEKERRERERIKQEAEQKAEAEWKAVEDKARREAEELRKKQSTPIYLMLKPYMDWYVQNWNLFVSKNKDILNAISQFSKIFDINAMDFAANLRNSFEKCNNVFPADINMANDTLERWGMLCPDEVRLLFKNLFNEKDSFKLKMILYRSQTARISRLIRERGGYDVGEVDLDKVEIVAAYLALAYPERYYFYDMFALLRFCEKIKINVPGKSLESKYEFFEELCDNVKSALTANPTMLRLCNETFDKEVVNYHILTYCFISDIARSL